MPLIAVLGPTGSGKSDLALHLAENLNGEIVGCDSVQVYRGLDIGSAKVPVEERRGIPHHVIDILAFQEELTAGAYASLAREALNSIRQKGRLPIVVGGTGFYFRALLHGLSPTPRRDETLRRRLRELSKRRPLALYRVLRRFDPVAAGRIHPNDHQKLIRAIELTLLTRQPASRLQACPRNALEGYTVLKIGLNPNRSALYQRLNDRTNWMFKNGLLDETQRILDSGVPPAAKLLQSLGYKQAVQILTEGLAVERAVAECQIKTRQYAKRQMTWFRAEPGIEWLPSFGTDCGIQARAMEWTLEFLRSNW